MPRQRYWLLALVAVAVVVVGVVSVRTGRSGNPDAEGVNAAPSERRSEAANTGLTAARARELETALNARSTATIADAVAVGADHNPAQVAREALPDGAQLRIDETTFMALDEPGYGTVEAVITGTIDASVTLLLSAADGPWRIIGTTEPEPRT